MSPCRGKHLGLPSASQLLIWYRSVDPTLPSLVSPIAGRAGTGTKRTIRTPGAARELRTPFEGLPQCATIVSVVCCLQ